MSLISLYTPLHAIRDFDITLIKELATAILAKNEPYSTGLLAICAANREVNRRCSKLVCCKRTHGFISCYRWFDYFRTLCVRVENPTYNLDICNLMNNCKFIDRNSKNFFYDFYIFIQHSTGDINK